MRMFFVLLAAVGALTTAACNTVAGAGKDIKATGQAVQDTAEDAKPK